MSNLQRKKRVKTFDVFLVVLFSFILLIMVYPFWNVVMISIVDKKTVAESGFLILPKNITFEAYRYLFSTDTIWNSLGVSVFVTVVGTIVNLFLTITYAYALSIKNLPGRKIFVTIAIIPLFFTGGLIPFYLQVRNLGLLDTIFALILPVGINIWYLIIVKNYFMEVPESIKEAARMDGANQLQVLYKIVLPLSKPMIATFTMFYAVERWNEWFNAVLFIQDASKMPLQKILRDLVFNNFANGDMAVSYRQAMSGEFDSKSIQMATAVITALPIAILFPFAQRYFVQGIMTGAVKE